MTDVILREDMVDTFWHYVRERRAILLRRRAGLSRPWTQDPILDTYKFTNVFREDDRTTQHFREYVREPLRADVLTLPATVLYRWFCLTTTGDTIFRQTGLPLGDAAGAPPAPPEGYGRAAFGPSPSRPAGLAAAPLDGPATPWQRWLATEDIRELEWAIRRQGAPFVTGAYMVRSPENMDKVEGLLSSFRNFWTQKPHFEISKGKTLPMDWRAVAATCLERRDSLDPVRLETVWRWLLNFYGMGPFMSHEVVIDLRHTDLLDRAPDIMTWSNPGPGALRGANLMLRGVNRGRKGRLDKSSNAEAHAVQEALLQMSRNARHWPQWNEKTGVYEFTGTHRFDDFGGELLDPTRGGTWPSWDMHQPEFALCELAKYVRTQEGFGRPRSNY